MGGNSITVAFENAFLNQTHFCFSLSNSHLPLLIAHARTFRKVWPVISEVEYPGQLFTQSNPAFRLVTIFPSRCGKRRQRHQIFTFCPPESSAPEWRLNGRSVLLAGEPVTANRFIVCPKEPLAFLPIPDATSLHTTPPRFVQSLAGVRNPLRMVIQDQPSRLQPLPEFVHGWNFGTRFRPMNVERWVAGT